MLYIFIGATQAGSVTDLPPENIYFGVLNGPPEEEVTASPAQPVNPSIPDEGQVQPAPEAVFGGVVYLKDIPTSQMPAGVEFQTPKSHIQGEYLDYQSVNDGGTGGTAQSTIPEQSPVPEIQVPMVETNTPDAGGGAAAPGDYIRQWTGINYTGWIPPDTIGAVGPKHIVEAVNSGFAIYTKLGTQMQGYTTFDSFLNKPSPWNGFMFDPRVIYDSFSDKFVMLVLGKDDTNVKSYVWIAVSQTSDPTQGWWTWYYNVTDTTGTSAAWLDYAGLGVDTNGVTWTGNYFYWSGGFRGSTIWNINPAILTGGASNGWILSKSLTWPSGASAFALQPAHPHSINFNNETFFVNTSSGSGNQVCLWHLTGPWSDTASRSLSRYAITIPAYEAIGNNIDQPGTTSDIDGGDARVMNAVYANSRVFFVITDDVNNDGTSSAWLTVKLDSFNNTLDWSHLLWSGTGTYLYYPAISLYGSSTSGNLSIFGTYSTASTYASGIHKIYSNQPTDATGPYYIFDSGGGPYTRFDSSGRNRWGDYSGSGYDWTCGNAWGLVEAANSDNTWRTTIKAAGFSTESTCPIIEVTSPNGGESWVSGSSHTITWKRDDLPASDVMNLYLTGPSTTLIASGISPTATSYTWTVPEIPTTVGKIFVGSWTGSSYTTYDYSDNNFTIVDGTPPSPDPMTFSVLPHELSTTQIGMTATTASDPSGGIQYLFDFTSSPTGGTGGTDSAWQAGTSYTDSGLLANHNYCYRVQARDALLNATSYSGADCDYTSIETPTGITFGAITSSSIQVQSTNTPSGLTRGSSGLYIDNTSAADSGWKQDNNLWTSGSLSPNTLYGFRAQARNGDATVTAWSSTSSRYTLANAPGAAAFNNITNTSVQVNWTTNGNPAGTLYLAYNATTGTNSGWTTATSWNNTGLTPNTAYAYQVYAINAESIMTTGTNLGTVSTLAMAPGVASFTNITPSSIQANWTANGNPAGTQYLAENTTTGANSGWTTALSWNNTGLTGSTPYTYRVQARNSAGLVTSWTNLGTTSTLATSIVTLSQDAYTVDELGGVASFPVSRSNSSIGAISVNCLTAPSTATAGVDYTHTDQLLSWADGDTADKLCQVPILNDKAYDLVETFTVGLVNPQGGATVGTPGTAVVTINPYIADNDFTRDNLADLLWWNSATRRMILMVTQPDGAISVKQVLGSSREGYNLVGVGDFDADGDMDILLYRPTDGLAAQYTMEAGVFTFSPLLNPGVGVQVGAIGDVDADGDDDVVWYDPATGHALLWKFDPITKPKQTDLGAFFRTGYEMKAAGDIDGDGDADILWYRPTDGNAFVWIMQNGAIFDQHSLGSMSTDFQFAGVGDTDADGDDDILWYNPTYDATRAEIRTWTMQDGQRVQVNITGRISADFELTEVIDLDGDGDEDLVFWNPATGGIRWWPMEGGLKTANLVLSAINPVYQLIK